MFESRPVSAVSSAEAMRPIRPLIRLVAMTDHDPSRGPRLGRLSALLLAGLLTWNFWIIHRAEVLRQETSREHRFWVLGHGSYPARQRAEAFVELVSAGNKEWRGAHLEGLPLDGVSLGGADLQYADFKGSSLGKAALVGTKFYKSKLQQTDLTEADLGEADLSSTDLFKAVMRRTKLRRANLRGASLEQIDAREAAFTAAQMSETYLLMADLTGANLSAADLTGANLEAAILKGANLSLARLSGVNLKDADFTDSNWWRARGLTSEQLATLAKSFAPSEKSPAALRDDYAAWLKTRQLPK